MLVSKSKFIEKKSRFLGYLYCVNSCQEIDEILDLISKEHRKANHICYGYLINSDEKFGNDKEVGQPGKVLLNLLKMNDLDSHLIVVVRYFGGIKLGQGGVQRAFRKCAQELL